MLCAIRRVAAAVLLAMVVAPAPSSAGDLVLSSNRCEQGPCLYSIWRASDDGSSLRRLTADPQPVASYYAVRDDFPSWSPDGRSVVYSRFEQFGRSGLYVVGSDGRGRRLITPPGPAIRPDWSPSGGAIAFESSRHDGGGKPDGGTGRPFGAEDQDIFLIDPNGSGLRRIVNGTGDELEPRFNEDGSRIEFLRVGTGPGGLMGEGDDSGWWSVRPDGTDERQLTLGFPPRPQYSPDGRFIALVTLYHDLFTMRADGTDVRHWARFPGKKVAWSPAGPTLFFTGISDASRPYLRAHRVDFSQAEPQAVPLTAGAPLVELDLDWTDGSGPRTVRDVASPVATLLGPRQRPLAPPRTAPAAAARTGVRVASVSRRKLRFFAADRTGVRRVEAAVGRVGRRGRCRFLGRQRLGRLRSCRKPLFRRIRGDAGWRSRTRRLQRGRYLIGFSHARRARQSHPAASIPARALALRVHAGS